MFQVDACVLHQPSGQSGKVVGYGHQIVDGVYLPTLIVRVSDVAYQSQRRFVEDLSVNWIPAESELTSQVA